MSDNEWPNNWPPKAPVQPAEPLRWDRTFRNWRWWSVMPMVLPASIIIFILYPLHFVLWPVGQWICNVSNTLADFRTPKWVRKLLNWAFTKYPESQR